MRIQASLGTSGSLGRDEKGPRTNSQSSVTSDQCLIIHLLRMETDNTSTYVGFPLMVLSTSTPYSVQNDVCGRTYHAEKYLVHVRFLMVDLFGRAMSKGGVNTDLILISNSRSYTAKQRQSVNLNSLETAEPPHHVTYLPVARRKTLATPHATLVSINYFIRLHISC